MPSYYSPTYYEDQKKEHDFYINLGNQCRIAENKKQALRNAQLEEQRIELEEQELLRQQQLLDKAKKVLETSRNLSHVILERNYTKDKQLVILPGKIAWRDSLSPEEEEWYREYLKADLGSTKIDVVNKIR
jgi:hypothetical protein